MQKPNLQSQYAYALFIYSMGYLYSIIYAPSISTQFDSTSTSINQIHESCFVSTDNIDFSRTRGENYYIDIMDPEKKNQIKSCAVTFWSFSHIVLYMLLGMFSPDLFTETLLVGILFELYELVEYDCHDILDVGFNTAGFYIGHFISQYMYTSL